MGVMMGTQKPGWLADRLRLLWKSLTTQILNITIFGIITVSLGVEIVNLFFM